MGDPVARFFLKLRYLGQWVEMWTPYDVHLYALQIKSARIFHEQSIGVFRGV